MPTNFEEIVNKIISQLADRWSFGIYSREDIAQEIYVFCLKGLAKYDGKRNLYNFLFTHTKNRLKNLKRDEFFRPECPCDLCSFKEDGDTDHNDKRHCKRYLNWFRSNSLKSNIANPIKFTEKFDVVDEENRSCETVDMNDFLDNIENDLPIELRETYLKMKSGVHVNNRDKEEILEYLKKYTV